MTFLLDDKIKLEQTAQTTAFARLRTAEARLLGEYRYMYGQGTVNEVVDKLEGAGAVTPDFARNCYLAQVGTASGDRVVRQTRQYHPYISGTSTLGLITFVMNAAKTGLTQEVGMFDDFNGFFLRVRDNITEAVIRKNGVDTEVVPQTAWNGDRLDGSMNRFNKSGFLANWSKAQILVIDYQWLGVGKVRFGLVLDDEIVTIHTFYHSNVTTEVYTNQPSLPFRWEIKNTATTASSSTLMVICASAYCEGADYETGFSRAISTDGTTVSVTAANATEGRGILAIRLKNTLQSKPVKALARLKNASIITNNDLNYKVVILNGSSSLSGSPTWTSVPGYGWCEYLKDFALAPGWSAANQYQVLIDDFAIGGQGNQVGTLQSDQFVNRSTAIYQNYDSTDSQILAIIGYRLVADATVRATLNWTEVK